MKQKSFVLQNKGMNRDLSISKVGESTAYDNRNIRIIARDNDTLLSVTNERGTKEISLGEAGIVGDLVGWNVFGNHIILFTHDPRYVPQETDVPDAEPDSPYSNTTYKYKIFTTLSDNSISASNGETTTATAIRKKKTYINGVEQEGDWVYDADVTNLGFWAPVGSEHIIISGNTITGLSSTGNTGAVIRSRGYAYEYSDAELSVDGNAVPDATVLYKVVTTADPSVINDGVTGNTSTLTAWLWTALSTDLNTWYPVSGSTGDVTSSGFEVVGDNSSVTFSGNVVTGEAAGTVTFKSLYSADYYENATIRVRHYAGPTPPPTPEPGPDTSDSGSGSGDGGFDPSVPGLQLISEYAAWNLDVHHMPGTAIDYGIRVYNNSVSPMTVSSMFIKLAMTEDQSIYPSSGDEVSYTTDSRTDISVTVPANDSVLVTGTIFGEFEWEANQVYWIKGWAQIRQNEAYIPVEDPEANVDTSLLLLALTSSSGSGSGDGDTIIPDRIYRIDYDGENFRMIRGVYTNDEGEGTDYQFDAPLFEGNLGFDLSQPIESIAYEETKDIKKIYWVDGLHVLRFMNFLEKPVAKTVGSGASERTVYVMPWENPELVSSEVVISSDNTYFDSNRVAGFGASVSIEKDNTGNTRANGTVQYLLTYFNKHGQETSYVWISDLVYLSPLERGGAADETNNNRITLHISGLDVSYSHFRIYSIFRSTLNGNTVSYLVSEQKTSSGTVTVVDDGAHLTVQDATRLMYLGSQAVVANTLAYKDQTLFLGDLKSVGRVNYDGLEAVIASNMFATPGTGEGDPWQSSCVYFEYTNDNTGTYNTTGVSELSDIPYKYEAGGYSYKSQLVYSSSKILTFKGGEKYRFALKFKMQDGTETDAFWIGDKENDKYPVIDATNNVIKRVVAVCMIPAAVIAFLKNTTNGKFSAVQLCIAEASYADRAVKAQGIINPTMFNVWERYNKRNYSVSSWVSRPRSLDMVNRHFAPVPNSTNSFGEIQCNYWPETESTPVPYFRYKDSGTEYDEEYTSVPEWDYLMLVFTITHNVNIFTGGHSFSVEVRIIELDMKNRNFDSDALNEEFHSDDFTDTDWKYSAGVPGDARSAGYVFTRKDEEDNVLYTMKAHITSVTGDPSYTKSTAVGYAWTAIEWELINSYSIPVEYVSPYSDEFEEWCDEATTLQGGAGTKVSFNAYLEDMQLPQGRTHGPGYAKVLDAMNALDILNEFQDEKQHRWREIASGASSNTGHKTPAYNKKNLMFIDENVVTLDSPEISYEAAAFDEVDMKFRIVGAAKLSSVITDYTVDATQSSVPGASLDNELFSGTIYSRNENINGLTSWPLWKEYGLDLRYEYDKPEYNATNHRADDYTLGNQIIRYWLYLWQRSGSISGYNFGDEEQKKKVAGTSELNRKVIANLRYSYSTTYLATRPDIDSTNPRIRLVNELPGAYSIGDSGTNEYYTGQVQMLLGMPGNKKYPIIYSDGRPDDTSKSIGAESALAYLSSNAPVLLEYASGAHALIRLPSTTATNTYTQRILPYFYHASTSIPTASGTTSGALLPWRDDDDTYAVAQAKIDATANHVNATAVTENDQYLFIGELYQTYGTGANDTRYGGTSKAAISNNRFIAAGPLYRISDMSSSTGGVVYGNQGDTYFQRWDDLRIKPFSNDSDNNVIDIVSVMLETHINLDGRTDKQRGIPQVASIDTTTFGQINPAYSQQNNFSVRRDLDSDFNLDSYRSSVTWTMQKNDMTAVDEWSHITLANTLKLDPDKGICRALRVFNNNIIAFQDKGISEVLFNSRTQISTTDGVPVEIANSGKVDGKRYISNKYGCLNKWSIAEGKGGLYFVDNINKAFCSLAYSQYGRAGVSDLSTKLGFGNWFRTRNSINPWTPLYFDNFISFYDRVHSDIYLVKKPLETEENGAPTLVFNELLGTFTSFFDYDSVAMLANVEDRFVSFHKKANGSNALWLQNEGAYGDFFGTLKPFWVQYRVTPDPYGDKVWTNVEYRADFYRTLSGDTHMLIDSEFANNQFAYQPNETFDFMRFWDEYQTTETDESKYNLSPIKKFRIWRQAIPRAMKSDTNPYGLDRIRNPWLNLLFKKNAPTATTKQDLMQLHDIIVTYYE